MPLLVRRARPSDTDSLTRIAQAAKRHWGYPEPWLAAWKPQLSITPDDLTRQAVFVAELDGRPAGFSALEPTPAYWSLEHLWVAPTYHGRGIGTALFSAATRYARSARPGVPIRIEADPNAEAFYRGLGARPAGKTPAPVAGHPRELPVLIYDEDDT